MSKVNVFISYSHKDDKTYLAEILDFLHEKTCPNIKVWYDRSREGIELGENWNNKISKSLADCRIVILVISQNFLTSEYINDTELRIAFERQERNQCIIIPVFAWTCDFNQIPKQIRALQGIPQDKTFLSIEINERNKAFTDLQMKVNKEAERLLSNPIYEQQETTLASGRLKMELNHLIKESKIFLSISEDHEVMKVRDEFIDEAEAYKSYNNWKYDIVPTKAEARAILASTKDDQHRLLSQHIESALFSVHMISNVSDIYSELYEFQYFHSRRSYSKRMFKKTIIWLLNREIEKQIQLLLDEETKPDEETKNRLTVDIGMNTKVSGTLYTDLITSISEQDDYVYNCIMRLVNRLPEEDKKKVYMLYDYDKDYGNKLRRDLKLKLEDSKCIRLQFNTHEELSPEFVSTKLQNRHGVILFYGLADRRWYEEKQTAVIDHGHVSAKLVCVDKPNIDSKVSLDVNNGYMQVIKGKCDLENGVKKFIKKLYTGI